MNIASTLLTQSKFEESEVIYRELLRVQQRVVGAEHPATLATRQALCAVLYGQKKYVQAEAKSREVLAAYRRVLGADHPTTGKASRLLSKCI
eukprot:m.177577 g.177577  ORF g.177577 m.177577 type:complete len:92 (+) comp24491_c4_seq8:3-278(+)